jgi:two-component system, NarL family, sensor histidine kinase DesK
MSATTSPAIADQHRPEYAMIGDLLRPSEDAIVSARDGEYPKWYPWLMLVWSIWIFLTPFYSEKQFPDWLWPTLASYAVFLVLFWRAYYRSRRHILRLALGMAMLGYALTPFNPGAQSYIIYACAFVGLHPPPRRAIAWMIALQALYLLQWIVLDWPLLYMVASVVVGFAVGLMNISYARKLQADAALRLSHDEVRRLAGLAERERIGRDLHDLLGHTLSLVALKSELAGKLVSRDPQAAQREIAEVSRVAREALAQVRAAVTGIRAAGMAAELASAKLLLESDGIAFRYQIDSDERPGGVLDSRALPPRIETALAMTVREAVTNIQRHARAQTAEIALAMRGGEALLEVSDDGEGGMIVPGNGLAGMRERVEALGGRLRIESVAGRGTRIEVRLPLAANHDASAGEG